MVNLVDKKPSVESEIKEAIENGYMPFLWDSCFGFKFNKICNEINSSNDKNVDTSAVIDNQQNVVHNNAGNERSKNENVNNLKSNYRGARITTSGSIDSGKIYKSEANSQTVNNRSEKCVGHNFERTTSFKVCNLEVQKIRSLLERVKNGDMESRQTRHNQIMKELIQSSLFEKWNATKQSLITT